MIVNPQSRPSACSCSSASDKFASISLRICCPTLNVAGAEMEREGERKREEEEEMEIPPRRLPVEAR